MPRGLAVHLPTLAVTLTLTLPPLVYLALKYRTEKVRRELAEANRQAERKGRIHAERRLTQKPTGNPGGSSEASAALSFNPIGVIESVYRQRNGTPRQGTYVPMGRARLRLRPDLNPAAALAGLENFGHCWVLFVFHANTNAHKEPGALKAKVKAPRLEGHAVGLFATRSPHRPCNIGLSVAVIDRVEKGTVHLSSVDLIDGTPVLDLKPYIPHDAVDPALLRLPPWLEDPINDMVRRSVTFTPTTLQTLSDFYDQLSHADSLFTTVDDARQFLAQALQYDIRSLHQRTVQSEGARAHQVDLDAFTVSFLIDGDAVTITALTLNRCPAALTRTAT